MTGSDRESLLLSPGDGGDFSQERLRWLIQLRWGAMGGTFAAAGAAFLVVPGALWEVMVAMGVVGLAYNFYLASRLDAQIDTAVATRNALRQALGDLLILTVCLWAAGGVGCPFLMFYVFHVALIAILGGPRWTVIASATSLAGAGLLALPDFVPALQGGVWNPVPPFDMAAHVAAFVTTLGGAAYIVTHSVRELRDRERALQTARDRAALEYQLLSNTLDELEAGLEVVDAKGQVLWRNKRAEELALSTSIEEGWECPGEQRPCEKDVEGVCPVAMARDGEPGRCRFAARIDGRERVYEMMVFPIDEREQGRVMNLYIDRTQAMLAERQLVLAERLASLGRVAQGVAHELNTPLATIATLAADMRQALGELTANDDIVRDIDESAKLIRDETGRLGRITQALLAGGDLVRARIEGHVPLAAAVERAKAIVCAGVRRDSDVRIDESIATFEVAADMDRLVQVLVNLLQNALDASREQGGEHVRVIAERDGTEVVLHVDDDGPGVSDEIRERLFEPFATTKPPGEGTGLGLYTSYMLIQAMGGQLTLVSRESGGARASVRLPRAHTSLPVMDVAE